MTNRGTLMVRAITNFAMPAALPALLDKYAAVTEPPGRFTPAIWQHTLRRRSQTNDLTALLRDTRLTRPTEVGKTGRLRRRTVTRDALLQACTEMDIGDENDVLQAFVLTMAWGSAVAGPNSLRSTVRAVSDPRRAYTVLSRSARTLRAARSLDDGALEATHHTWSLPGIGQSLGSAWWSFAGHVPGRDWQPLILDVHVYATLNTTLAVGGTARLAGTHRRPDRYRAYVEIVHHWAAELRHSRRQVDAERIAFVLSRHDGGAVPTTR